MRLDLALAALTSVAVVAVALATGDFSPGGTVPLALWAGVPLLFRRRWPVAVLAVTAVALAGFGATDLGTPGWVWPATAAYVTAVLAGAGWWALGIGVLSIGAMPLFAPAAQVGVEALWSAAVLAGAYAVRERTRVRRDEERMAAARELHDVVAHTLAVVGIHLNVAIDTLDDDPGEAREALRLAQSVRGHAMADLRAMLGALRSADATNLADLAARTTATGLPVRVSGTLTGLPAPTAVAAYRVVQEGLTNVLKHADATTATVTVHREPEAVTITVTDDGGPAGRTGADTATGGPPAASPRGYGLTGMRERVAALGGSVTAGAARDGFVLEARLPLP